MNIGRQELPFVALAIVSLVLAGGLALSGVALVHQLAGESSQDAETATSEPETEPTIQGDVEFYTWEEVYASGDLEWAWAIAVDHGDAEKVRRLLAEGVDPDTPLSDEPDYHPTALHSAARLGHSEVVRILLAAGADPLARTGGPGDHTPLYEAASSGDLEIVQQLVAAGAPVNEEREEGLAGAVQTPLYAAVGNFVVFQYLLEQGAEIDRAGGLEQLLVNAASQHDTETASFLLAKGASVEGSPDLLEYGYTPLWYAVGGSLREGREGMVRLLLEHGADPQRELYAGGTILDLAREQGQEDVVILMERAIAGEPLRGPVEAVPRQ